MAITTKDSTTYRADDLGDVKPKVEIGGKESGKFVPNVNMSFGFGGDEEFYFNINRKNKTITTETASLNDGKVKQTAGGDTDEYYIDTDGSLKWDIVFDSIPNNLDIEFKIKYSNDIEFYYQDTKYNSWQRYNHGMTWEEYDSHVIRHEHVEGSYAVYCNKKHNKYKTGKLCHIYAPLLIDNSGNKTYASMNIKGDTLTISLPSDYMKSAAYPVRLDPTIGYTTVGGSEYAQYNCGINRKNVTTDSSGGGTVKVYLYVRYKTSTVSVPLGLYNNNAGVPGTVFGQANVSVSNSTDAWVNVSLAGTLAGSTIYYPVSSQGDTIYQHYDDNGANSSWYNFDSAIKDNPAGLSADTWEYSLYAEYISAGTSPTGNVFESKTLRSLTFGRVL